MEINLQPKPFVSCDTREEKEAHEICFRENEACHLALKKGVEPPQADWQVLALAIAGGVIGGMIISQQLRH